VVFGTAGDGVTLDADTVFEIGSITKTMTATVLAQDVRSGNLTLDTPVATLLPDFKIPSRGGKPITLLDLATQFSGLPRMPTNMTPADPGNPAADYGPDNLMARRLFRPLNMTMSGTSPSGRMRAHLAMGHRGDGSMAKNWTFDALAGAGAVLSSSKDMLTYLRMNMGQIELPGGNVNAIAHTARRDAGNGQRIGLAWMTLHDRGSDVVWHNGETGGYHSFLGFRADGRRGVVLLANTTRSVDDLGFAALLDDAPLAPTRRAIALDPEALRAYVGRYRVAPNVEIEMTLEGDQLLIRLTGQSAFPVYASAKDKFFLKVVDAQLDFERGAGGDIVALVLHQNGLDARAERIGEP